MSEYISEFNFNLENPIEVHKEGQIEKAYELILKAPSNKQRREAAKLKQGFFRAIKGMADNKGNVEQVEQENEGTITGSEVISIIMMSNVDLNDYQESFRELLLNGACFIGEQKLTSPLYDKLLDSDTERLMGEYVANFLLASHLSKMSKK